MTRRNTPMHLLAMFATIVLATSCANLRITLSGIHNVSLSGIVVSDRPQTTKVLSLNWIAKPPSTIVVQIGDQIDRCRPYLHKCYEKIINIIMSEKKGINQKQNLKLLKHLR